MRIGFLLFDGFQPIDMAGPWQAFTSANEEMRKNLYGLQTVGLADKVYTADQGLTIEVSHRIDDVSGDLFDMVFVPGGPGVQQFRHCLPLRAWLLKQNASSLRTCSVCTGAFLLASAGLLDNQTVTTHWSAAEQLQREFPLIKVAPERIYCESDKYWTSAGVTAGIDLSIALIERDCGFDISQRSSPFGYVSKKIRRAASVQFHSSISS